MSRVDIDLLYSPGAQVLVNNLESRPTVADLDQDLVLVELPGGLMVDVSWYPEHDPQGGYYVMVCRRDDWDKPLRVAEASTPMTAALLVAELASQFNPLTRLTSCASDNESRYFERPVGSYPSATIPTAA